MKILITGGHLTPALSFIDYVKEKHPKDKMVFVGRQYSQDILKQEAVERYEVDQRNIKFVPFSAERLGRGIKFLINKLPNFINSVKGATKILKREKPDIFLSFGGYVAVPFSIAAWLQKIPIVTHEQTSTAGKANKLIGIFSQKIAVSFPETVSEFPAKKAVVTGNLLRKGVFQKKHPRPKWFTKTKSKNKKPILLIMGGNQGAQVINEYIRDNLKSLVEDWIIVHLCGRPTARMNYKEVLEREKSHLPKELQKNYYVEEWLDGPDLFWLYRNSLGAFSRSGANTTQELAATALPSIFVPLPQAYKNEQRLNAEKLVDVGGAIILDQKFLDKEHADLALDQLKKLNKQMRSSLQKLDLTQNAPAKVYQVVQDVIGNE